MVIRGRLERKPFGQGSKSAHQAVYIITDKGKEYVLRRVEGNEMNDPVLLDLLGEYVEARGSRHDYLFLAESIEPIKKPA
jgi:DNA-binding PadR family transcriptional regulator